MKCPNCKKETSSFSRSCEHCDLNLDDYQAEREYILKIRANRKMHRVGLLMIVGGLVGTAAVIFPFLFGYIVIGWAVFIPPVILILGTGDYIYALKKKRKLKSDPLANRDLDPCHYGLKK